MSRFLVFFLLLVIVGCTSTVEKADTAFKAGDYPKAVDLYRKALDDTKLKAPEIARIRCGIGKSLDKLNRIDEAVEEYRQAVDLKPDEIVYYLPMADDLDAMGLIEQEISVLQKASILDPKNAHVAGMLGVAYAKLGQYNNAKAQFDEALRLDPKNPENYDNLGLLSDKTGNADAAIKYWEAALKVKPDYENALMNLGAINNRLNRYAEAQKAYKKLVEMKPENPKMHNFLAVVYYNNAQYREALAEFEKVSKLDNEFPGITDNLRLAKRGVATVSRPRPRG